MCTYRYLCIVVDIFFFFFKQKTAYEMRISDWSSDVCSSDLGDGTSCSSPRHRGPLLSTANCRASHAESAGCPGDSYPATRGCGVGERAWSAGPVLQSKWLLHAG